MKTLVIHPFDVTTDFLSKIYLNKNYTIIRANISNGCMRQLIKEHNRIIMLGHGCEFGLYGHNRLIINSTLVYLLRNKDCVCVWCNADIFVDKYKLKGFFTGMILSDYDECITYAIPASSQEIKDANTLLAESIEYGLNTDAILENIHEKYIATNHITQFNKNNLYFRS